MTAMIMTAIHERSLDISISPSAEKIAALESHIERLSRNALTEGQKAVLECARVRIDRARATLPDNPQPIAAAVLTQAPTPLQKTLLQRIWTAFVNAIKAAIDFISLNCCGRRKEPVPNPELLAARAKAARSALARSCLQEEAEAATAAAAALNPPRKLVPVDVVAINAIGPLPGCALAHQKGCAFEFLSQIWPVIDRGEVTFDAIRRVIDSSIRNGSTKNVGDITKNWTLATRLVENEPLSASFPNIVCNYVESLGSTTSYSDRIQALEQAARRNPSKCLSAAVLHKGITWQVLLIDTLDRQNPLYYYFKPRSYGDDPIATLHVTNSKNELVAHLNKEFPPEYDSIRSGDLRPLAFLGYEVRKQNTKL